MSKPHELLKHPQHLATRLVWTLRAGPPAPEDTEWAHQHLLAGERDLFDRMSDADRSHSIAVARRFIDARPRATRDEIAGALLHDVGKITSNLSTWERVAASIVGGRTKRFRAYQNHEHIGSELARAAGSSPETVELIAERGPAFDTLHRSDH